MTGEYGIGAGIAQGLQAVSQGFMNARRSIQASREQRRQNAEKLLHIYKLHNTR